MEILKKHYLFASLFLILATTSFATPNQTIAINSQVSGSPVLEGTRVIAGDLSKDEFFIIGRAPGPAATENKVATNTSTTESSQSATWISRINLALKNILPKSYGAAEKTLALKTPAIEKSEKKLPAPPIHKVAVKQHKQQKIAQKNHVIDKHKKMALHVKMPHGKLIHSLANQKKVASIKVIAYHPKAKKIALLKKQLHVKKIIRRAELKRKSVG